MTFKINDNKNTKSKRRLTAIEMIREATERKSHDEDDFK